MMKPRIYTPALFLALALARCTPASAQDTTARAWIRQAMVAMGGEEALSSLESIRLEGLGHEFVLDAFAHPDGPKPVEYDQFTTLRDLKRRRQREALTGRLPSSPGGRTFTVVGDEDAAAVAVDAGGQTRSFPAPAQQHHEAVEALALAPERLLFTAAAAEDLHAAADTVMAAQSYHQVVFSWQGLQVHVYLHAFTHLPTAVETRGPRPYNFSWAMWRTATEWTTYYAWSLEPNGMRYPRQWDVVRNGMPFLSRMLTHLAFDVPTPDDSLAIDDETRAAFHVQQDAPPPIVTNQRPEKQVRPGITSIPSTFPALIVEQDDGVVVVEAPVSPEYTDRVLAAAGAHIPADKPMTAVIGAGALTQFGGVGAFARRGDPVYGVDTSEHLLTELMESAKTGGSTTFHAVSTMTALGSGKNRMELYPVRGQNDDRALVVYFPALKLLYAASVLVPKRFDAIFQAERRAELIEVVRREHLDVEAVFSMFMPEMPWETFLQDAGADG